MSCGVRRTAPVVPYRAVREMVIYFARVYCSAFTYELQQKLCSPPACSRPRLTALGWYPSIGAGMHQRLYGLRDEAVNDKEVFLDAEFLVAAFEVAGTVILDSMAQHKVLSAGRRADRVGLHKP